MNSKVPVIAIAAVLLIAGYFYTVVDWNARAVRKQLDALAELVEKDGPVSTFDSVGRSRKLPGFFADNPSVEYFPGRRLPKDLDAMSGAFLSVWGEIDTASVRISRHEVEVNDERAESMITARCSVVIDGSEKMGDVLDYRINWAKIEGDWLIRSVVALSEF